MVIISILDPEENQILHNFLWHGNLIKAERRLTCKYRNTHVKGNLYQTLGDLIVIIVLMVYCGIF